MALEDGNEYAKGNYLFGEWCADRALQLLEETGIDKASVALIGSHGQTVSGCDVQRISCYYPAHSAFAVGLCCRCHQFCCQLHVLP